MTVRRPASHVDAMPEEAVANGMLICCQTLAEITMVTIVFPVL